MKREVQRGECLSLIAFESGFLVETIWNRDENASLRTKRTSPYVLHEGDVIEIPDKRLKRVSAATGQRHRFRRRGVPELIRLELREYGEPRVDLEYALEVETSSGPLRYSGKTDADGKLQHGIPPDALRARLTIGDTETYELLLGDLDPISFERGVRQRLCNLGCLSSVDADEEAYRAALFAFQCREGLEPSGVTDEETCARLELSHQS